MQDKIKAIFSIFSLLFPKPFIGFDHIPHMNLGGVDFFLQIPIKQKQQSSLPLQMSLSFRKAWHFLKHCKIFSRFCKAHPLCKKACPSIICDGKNRYSYPFLKGKDRGSHKNPPDVPPLFFLHRKSTLSQGNYCYSIIPLTYDLSLYESRLPIKCWTFDAY